MFPLIVFIQRSQKGGLLSLHGLCKKGGQEGRTVECLGKIS